MAKFVPPGFAHCVLSFSVSGSAKPMATTLGVDHPVSADAQVVASGVYAAFTGTGAPFSAPRMFSEYSFEGVEVFMGPIGGPEFDGQAGPQGSWKVRITGSSTGAGLPPNCAVLIRKNTAFGGRRYRGRFFVPPVQAQEQLVNQLGVIDATTTSNIQTSWNVAYDALTAGGMLPVLFHNDEDPWRVPTPVISFGVQSLMATQRRRLR